VAEQDFCGCLFLSQIPNAMHFPVSVDICSAHPSTWEVHFVENECGMLCMANPVPGLSMMHWSAAVLSSRIDNVQH